jgi:hypothetical protein
MSMSTGLNQANWRCEVQMNWIGRPKSATLGKTIKSGGLNIWISCTYTILCFLHLCLATNFFVQVNWHLDLAWPYYKPFLKWSDKGMILALRQLFLLLTMFVQLLGIIIKRVKMSQTWARLGFTGQSGVYWTCLVLALSTGRNWPLSGFCSSSLAKIHRTVLHRTCLVG